VDALLQVCLSNTLVALVLAAAALGISALGRWPAGAHWLWVLVLLKLVTPPLALVPLSWPTSRAAVVLARPDPGPVAAPLAPSPGGDVQRVSAFALRANTTATGADGIALSVRMFRQISTRTPPSSGSLALVCWLGVASVWWGWAVVRIRRFRSLLGSGESAPPAMQDQARELAQRLRLKHTPEVWLVPAPISPMLWALGARPKLVVPTALWERLGQDQRAALLVHELAHLKRRDHWVRILEIFATGLYWWNPLVWWARRSLRETEEQSCDAWVVWAFPQRAQAYAHTLLETLDYLAGAWTVEPMAASGLASATRLKRRLTKILSGATSKHLTWPGTVTLLGLTTAALALGPRYAPTRYYEAMDLGTLGGKNVDPRKLSANGQTVGLAETGKYWYPRLNQSRAVIGWVPVTPYAIIAAGVPGVPVTPYAIIAGN